ncbi:glutamate receptor 2.2-like [Rosa rugosa]|uniref:glutamate receptor 2.2-like n=1 Tax=Rosa rugosa TaxID=74645 RepID=UPI002B412285|nr:glutamate receptor 2.2-like [Rosa rugosa]
MKKKKYPKFALLIFFFSLCSWYGDATPQSKTNLVNIGVLLDDLNSREAKIWKSCLDLALSDFYYSNSHYKSKLVLNTQDSKKTVVGAAAAAVNLIKKSQVQAILGPVTSKQTNFVINLGDQAHVPIISFSATSPALTSLRSSYFFQFSENDSCQVRAISALVEEFGWRQVVPILVDNEFAEGVMSSLTDALQNIDAGIPHRSFIRASATDDQIVDELYKLMKMETRVFIVHMTTDLSSRLFSKANELGMMSEGYVWISTTEILNSLQSLNSSVIYSMQGVLGVQTHIPRTIKLEELKQRWKLQFQQNNPTIIDAQLDVFGLWLYDAAQALAMAVEKVGTTSTLGFQTSNASLNLTDLETLGVSKYGPKLCQALSMTRFEGIVGDFRIVDRQLQSSTFEVVNVNGGGATTIGFWTKQNGLLRKLGSLANSSSKCNLGPIIWPGESLSVPKGWELPKKGKKLRIGVPVKLDFTELVKITKDPKTGTTDVTGFCADIFKAVVEGLPYALPYDLIPFAKPDGSSAGTENELCYQVHLGNYDAVVGDITINAKMSEYTEFSMPYAEANVAMVVPVIDLKRKGAWTFLKPWSWDLWVATSCFCLFIGFVVWLLEPTNPNNNRHILYQIGTFVLLSFPIIYLTNADRVRGNLSRFVLIMWIIFLGILIQSYEANLETEYTKLNVKPIVTDINYLLKRGESIGYIAGAYTFDILRQAGFDSSKLKGFGTMKDIDQALSKGSANGGIGAFVGGTSHMHLFLQKYCSKYIIVANVFKTMGYGFVFPKRSPLLSDISQAILNLRGGEKMINISNIWLKKHSDCQELIPSSRLGLDSFWELFSIVFICSILAIMINLIDCIRAVWNNLRASVWNRITAMFNRIVTLWLDIKSRY